MANSVKQEIDRELQLEELRQSLLEEKRKVELLSMPVRHNQKENQEPKADSDDADEKVIASKSSDGEP
jgi:sec-independent protein translocase protein TatB